MAVPTSRFDFQVYGSRDDMLIIPPPGQLRPPRRTTALYMISSPLPSDIEAIRFHITSHDQGWANDPQGPNWTWFAVSVLRPLAEGVGRPIHFEDNECIKSQPGDFGAQFQDSDYYFENIPTEDEDSEDQMSTISIPLVDNQLGLQWQHHSITWSRDDNQNHGGRFIRLLEEGDCIAIWACAEFPGWVNHVKKASMFVSSTPITIPERSDVDRQALSIEGVFESQPSSGHLPVQNTQPALSSGNPGKRSVENLQSSSEEDTAKEIVDAYLTSGDIDYVDRCLLQLDLAISSIPIDHPNRHAFLHSIGMGFYRRYEKNEQSEDLEKAVVYSQLAMLTEPLTWTYRAFFAKVLLARYHERKHESDLDACIDHLDKAIACIPAEDGRVSENLVLKLEAFMTRYLVKGKVEDYDQASAILNELLLDISPDIYLQASYGDFIRGKLQYSYDEHENTAEDDKWIGVTERALLSIPRSDERRVEILLVSAMRLKRRFGRNNDLQDLETSILRLKEAVSFFVLQTKPCPPNVLVSLAESILGRFKRTHQVVDLDEAKEYIDTALSSTHTDHDITSLIFANIFLCQCRLGWYHTTQDLAEIETGLRTLEDLEKRSIKKATVFTQVAFFLCLGVLQKEMYLATRCGKHLETAITSIERALDIMPEAHPPRGATLMQHASLLMEKFNTTNDIDDARKSFQSTVDAFCDANVSPLERIMAARRALHVLRSQELWEDAAKLVLSALPLVSYACGRDLNRQDQIHTARQVSVLSTEATFIFLRAGNVVEALVSLEFSRGLIINSLLDDPSDISKLQQAHPELAEQYNTLRLRAFQSTHSSDVVFNHQGQNERRAAFTQLQCLEDRIREEPGFEHFQQLKSLENLPQFAEEGPIVIVNSTHQGSDGIIITASCITHLQLPEMTPRAPLGFQERLKRSGQVDIPAPRDLESDEKLVNKSTELLTWLWVTCVGPILRLLVSNGDISTQGELSRIWWIGTGPAGLLPFHAAGEYIDGVLVPGQSCLDKVVSSYTPSIKVLNNTRARTARKTSLAEANNSENTLLLVTMETTPGQPDLLGARQESRAIIKTAAQSLVVEELEQPSSEEVLGKLRDHVDIVHFACHGYSDPSDPSQSHLLLQKHSEDELVVDKLSVTNLLDTRIEGRAWIAYLSACSTANIKDAKLADESLHITSGFLIAGFAHVIGSLWSADDDVCVRMATHFYSSLLTKRANTDVNRAVAQAVHDAQLQIRREYADDPSLWALYVHVGA